MFLTLFVAVLSLLKIIALACVLALSYLLNIWFTYYICCRARRRKKRHLTAVRQRELSRKTTSQHGSENLALEDEGDENCTPVSQENQVFRHNDIHSTRSKRVRCEHAPTSDAACHQEQKHHVYQRLQSCLFDQPAQTHPEVLETPGHSPPNQQAVIQARIKSQIKPSYRSLSPQIQTATKGSSDNDNQQDGNLYQKLLLRNMLPEDSQTPFADHDSRENGNKSKRVSDHDYVEVISDEAFAKIAMVTPTSQAETGIRNAYEALKPAPGPTLKDETKEYACAALVEDQQLVRPRETQEADYLEPTDEKEAFRKGSISGNGGKTGKH